jgi:hypothetical protein
MNRTLRYTQIDTHNRTAPTHHRATIPLIVSIRVKLGEVSVSRQVLVLLQLETLSTGSSVALA